MDDEKLLNAERDARLMAHNCPVYSSTKDSEHDQRIKATRSSATSAACGNRWMEFRSELKRRGLTPKPLTQ